MKGDYSRLALFCAACFCLLCRPAAAQVLITENEGGFTFELREGRFGGDQFGFEIAPIADLDGNGIRELVVASRSAGGGSSDLYILFLNRDGTVLRNTKIVDPLGGAVSAIDVLGDVDGDGVQEILLAGFDALFQASLNRERNASPSEGDLRPPKVDLGDDQPRIADTGLSCNSPRNPTWGHWIPFSGRRSIPTSLGRFEGSGALQDKGLRRGLGRIYGRS